MRTQVYWTKRMFLFFPSATTQLARQSQQERTQVVCSNRKAQKRPAESAMDLGHINVVLKWCMCV